MNADGSLVAASPDVITDPNVTAKFIGQTGSYEVGFDRTVRGVCAPVVSLHLTDSVIPKGFATTYFTSDSQVGIVTWDKSGTPADEAFDLILMC
jgi:hypothetical protein